MPTLRIEVITENEPEGRHTKCDFVWATYPVDLWEGSNLLLKDVLPAIYQDIADRLVDAIDAVNAEFFEDSEYADTHMRWGVIPTGDVKVSLWVAAKLSDNGTCLVACETDNLKFRSCLIDVFKVARIG